MLSQNQPASHPIHGPFMIGLGFLEGERAEASLLRLAELWQARRMEGKSTERQVAGSVSFEQPSADVMYIRFVGALTDSAFDAYLKKTTESLMRGGPRVVVLDASRAGPPNAGQRARQAAWQQRYDAIVALKVLRFVFVMESALLRGALTAILWIQPLSAAHEIVPSEREALARARQILDAAIVAATGPGSR